MRPHLIRKAIDQYARRRMSRPPDLWPAVRRALAQPPPKGEDIHVTATGPRAGWLVPAALLAGVALVALMLLSLLAQLGNTVASGAASPTAHPAGGAPAAAVQANPTATEAGISDTIMMAGEKAIPRLFGMDSQEFAAALQRGETLQNLEQAHHISHQQVREAVLAAARTALQAGVQSGEWTQAAADATANSIEVTVDQVLAKLEGTPPADDPAKAVATPPADDSAKAAATLPADDLAKLHATPPADGPSTVSGIGTARGDLIESSIMEAIVKAIAGLLSMDEQEFTNALLHGETLQSLEQTHHVSHQQVRDVALAAARTALQAGVQSGKWTQAAADATANSLEDTADRIVAKLAGVVPVDDPAKAATPPADDPAKAAATPPADDPAKAAATPPAVAPSK
jgi:hypothetical protein